MLDTLLLALGMLLIVEGLIPMVSPLRWRRLFEQLLQLENGQIRFFGLFMGMVGSYMVWLLS